MRKLNIQFGFSLVELIVVMAVLSILGWAATPFVEIAIQREQERELKRALWEIRDALDNYRKAVEEGTIEGGGTGFPESLDDLVVGSRNLKRPGATVYFLRRIPRDPFARPEVSAEEGWATRNYQSSATEPRPGADVYDVYSKSKEVGLNGVPLSQW